MPKNITLKFLKEEYAICLLSQESAIPSWLNTHSFYSITKTDKEISIMCERSLIPNNLKMNTGWKGIVIVADLDFSMIGILESILKPLAEANISILTISTYLTDYIFIQSTNTQKAKETLLHHGFLFVEEE